MLLFSCLINLMVNTMWLYYHAINLRKKKDKTNYFFIFFQKESGKYAEIFTEEEYGMNAPSNSTIQNLYKLSLNNEENKFGKTYVRPTLYTITQYLTEEERQQFTNGQVNFSINKKRILEIYNIIREQQSIKKMENAFQEKKLEKQYILNHKKGQ